MKGKKKKIIIIAGATASGKSKKALELAEKRNIKIINADSRQIYKGLEKFSGLDDRERNNYLVSFLEPWKKYSAGDFQKDAERIIQEEFNKRDQIVVSGGSSFYLKSLIFKNLFPEVEPDFKLRNKLENKSLDELMAILEGLDKRRAEEIDSKNKVRIIRAIEIAQKLGCVPENKKEIRDDWGIEFIWVWKNREEQKKLIGKNFKKRVAGGIISEAENLKKEMEQEGFSKGEIKKVFSDLGLAFKNIFDYWEGKIDKDEFIKLGILEEQRYAKRQNTFLKKLYQELPESEINKKILE